ncbi:hypothetical protein TNCT_141552 [Trichonephila clavata]|uniref:Uncharacterized protein n=1 Tax=Trichonephila clavata TaxID=2740835 RepID=A0A8X6L074_TRICU|nr:hypothetical protein TNCT_141552 [Trichonephila clavata]
MNQYDRHMKFLMKIWLGLLHDYFAFYFKLCLMCQQGQKTLCTNFWVKYETFLLSLWITYILKLIVQERKFEPQY